MTDIEQKALALLNEVAVERGYNIGAPADRRTHYLLEVVCRAIEQHEAYKQEVSDAVTGFDEYGTEAAWERLSRFIIPKPDPLVEVLADMGLKPKGGYDWASEFRNTLAQRGGKIVWGEG